MPKHEYIECDLKFPPQPITNPFFFGMASETISLSICITGLMNNFLGFLAVCIQLNHISYKNKQNHNINWTKVFALAEKARNEQYWPASPEISPHNDATEVVQFVENLFEENFNFHPNPQIKELIFLGDVLCGPGASTFLTLVTLRYLFSKNINYKIILSYQDALIAAHQFSIPTQQSRGAFAKTFDYAQYSLVMNWEKIFQTFYIDAILNKTFITLEIFENSSVFLISGTALTEQSLQKLNESLFPYATDAGDEPTNLWRTKISLGLTSPSFGRQDDDSFIDGILNYYEVNSRSRPERRSLLSSNVLPTIGKNIFPQSTDLSTFAGTNVIVTNTRPIFDMYPISDVHPKSPFLLKVTYFFLSNTENSNRLKDLSVNLARCADMRVLKAGLRIFSGVLYFLDEKVQDPTIDATKTLVQSLSLEQKNFFIEKIKNRIAFLRTKQNIQPTRSITSIQRFLSIRTNSFGICATLSLLWIQSRINLFFAKQKNTTNINPTKMKKKEFYFSFVQFDRIMREILTKLFTQYQISKDDEEKFLDGFFNTEEGRAQARAASQALYEHFNIDPTHGYPESELTYVYQLKNFALIDCVLLHKTYLSNAIFQICNAMKQKSITDLFLFLGLSPRLSDDPSSFGGHADAISLNIRSEEIKIRFYDPNHEFGHVKYSIPNLSPQFIQKEIDNFFAQPLMVKFIQPFLSISIFCLIPQSDIATTGQKLFGTPLMFAPHKQSDINSFVFSSLRHLIAESDKNFKIEPFFCALQTQIKSDEFKDLLNTIHDPRNGSTLLMYATTSENPNIIKMLLSAGADPTIPNPQDQNKTALDYANERFFSNPHDSTASLIKMTFATHKPK